MILLDPLLEVRLDRSASFGTSVALVVLVKGSRDVRSLVFMVKADDEEGDRRLRMSLLQKQSLLPAGAQSPDHPSSPEIPLGGMINNDSDPHFPSLETIQYQILWYEKILMKMMDCFEEV